MKILALETSAKSVSTAVVENGAPLAYAYQCTGLTHSRTLMPMVDAMLKNAELTLGDMDAVAVAAGPGSFTGLRIGIAAVKGLAWAADKPCFGVSTLEAMAQNLAHMDGLLVCAMDARRNQVYNALFEAKSGVLTRLTPDRAIAVTALAEELRGETRRLLVLGDGGRLCRDGLAQLGVESELAPAQLLYQNAVGVGLAAEHGTPVSAQELAPVYLRISQAERERNARLLLAEIEKDISEMFVEAAEVYEGSDKALQLRTMSLIYESVKDKGGLVIAPSAFGEAFNNIEKFLK